MLKPAYVALLAMVSMAVLAFFGSAAQAHPPGQFGLDVTVLSVAQDPQAPYVLDIDLEIYNDSGLAKTLRGIAMPAGGRVAWTRGKLAAPARFARIDAGETWHLANRFNPLRLELLPDADVSDGAVIWLELNFGRDERVDVRFTQEGVNGIDWSDESNWFTLDVQDVNAQ